MSDPTPTLPPSGGCDQLRELLPAYSLGATDPEETRLVEALLAECPEEAAELAAYDGLKQALLYSAPPMDAPAGIHDRLMAAVSPPATAAPAPRAVPTAAPPRRPRRALWAFALAAAALLFMSNVYWAGMLAGLRQQQESVLAALLSSESQRVDLAAAEGVVATVVYNPNVETALLYSDRLPALDPDRAYQLWLIDGETPVSGGVFRVDERGVASLIFTPERPLSDYAALAISEEPASGSSAPSTDPLAFGQAA